MPVDKEHPAIPKFQLLVNDVPYDIVGLSVHIPPDGRTVSAEIKGPIQQSFPPYFCLVRSVVIRGRNEPAGMTFLPSEIRWERLPNGNFMFAGTLPRG